MTANWSRPNVAVGDVVAFYKFKNSVPRAFVVCDVQDKTITGMKLARSGGGWEPVDCVFHVDDPELEERPQMQEAMWDHSDLRKMVNILWDRSGIGDVALAVEPKSLNLDTRQDVVSQGENRELDQLRQMMHAGILDKGRLCKETGVHHKRVQKELEAFVAKKKELANS